jgi:hypothetical protein
LNVPFSGPFLINGESVRGHQFRDHLSSLLLGKEESVSAHSPLEPFLLNLSHPMKQVTVEEGFGNDGRSTPNRFVLNRWTAMPCWGIYCLFCHGYILDALLECIPAAKRSHPAHGRLFNSQPGAALACPYCNGLIGFDDAGQPRVPEAGWPVFRYGQAELEIKEQADGEPPAIPLPDWALRQRFIQPGTHDPFTDYTYAEQAPPDETVP